jgi:hypothetical protein
LTTSQRKTSHCRTTFTQVAKAYALVATHSKTKFILLEKQELWGGWLLSRYRGKADEKPKLSGGEPPEMSIIT